MIRRLSLLLAALFLTGVPVRAEDKLISAYETAVLDCPISLPARPDLFLTGGDGRRRGDQWWTAGKPDDLETKFRGVEHFATLVEVFDDWNLVCHYHSLERQNFETIEIPVPGYLVRIDFLKFGPMNQSIMLRLWGTYLRERPISGNRGTP